MMHDPLIDAIAGAAIVTQRDLATPRIEDAVAGLARAVVADATTDTSRARRRPRGWLVIAIAVGLGTVPTGVAIGYMATAHTGLFGNAAFSEEDGSEWLRTNAADFREVAAGLVPTVALPVGATWTSELDRLAASGQSEPALIQVTGVRRDLEWYARCAWLAHWAASDPREGTADTQKSLAILDASVAWPATVATDGGGIRDSMRAVNKAARAGDKARVRELLGNSCDGFPTGDVR